MTATLTERELLDKYREEKYSGKSYQIIEENGILMERIKGEGEKINLFLLKDTVKEKHIKEKRTFSFVPGDVVHIKAETSGKRYTVEEIRWYRTGVDIVLVDNENNRYTVCEGDIKK